MATEPAPRAALPEFRFDSLGSKKRLMTAFEALEALPPSTRDRIRFRIWGHLNELPERGMGEDRNDLDAYVVIAGLLSALALAPILAFMWSSGQWWPLRTAAMLVAEVPVVLALSGMSDWGIGRFVENRTIYSAMSLVTAALLVLAIRGLPQLVPTTVPWLVEGLRAGLSGAVILLSTPVQNPTVPPVENPTDRGGDEPQAVATS